MRWVTFNNKKCAVSSDDAKEIIRKDIKKSKKFIDDEYDVVYAKASKSGRGASLKTGYSICVKLFANTVFIVPKKYRKEAKHEIGELKFKGNLTF